VLVLSTAEQTLAQGLPTRLNQGECEAIALTQSRRANLLSNDKRAVRYCQMQKLRVVDLADLLRLFWIERIVSYEEVEQLVTRIERVENLILSENDRAKIFSSRPRQGRRR
jgi:predicted nucleic acid-binding protein